MTEEELTLFENVLISDGSKDTCFQLRITKGRSYTREVHCGTESEPLICMKAAEENVSKKKKGKQQ